jgi:hypothetical protein
MRLFVLVLILALVPLAWGSNCAQTSVGFTPLIDMGPSEQYQGEDGMLYPGSNTCPPDHFSAVMAAANSIVPLDSAGNPSPSGKIVWFSCGMSNTNGKTLQEIAMVNADPAKAPDVHFVNGANGGIPVEDMVSPTASYWTTTVPSKLSNGGVTAEQVQVVWLLQTHRSPSGPFGTWYLNLRDDLGHVCRNLYATFPNLKIIYLSPRSYAGYADGTLNPEPYAYQSGFSVKKLIDDQLSGDSTLTPFVQTALLYWSEYLYIWADGTTPNSMGLSYQCSDYDGEGTHPSSAGYTKIAAYMLNFYQTDPTCVWYRGTGSPPTSATPPTTSSPPSPTETQGNCYDPNHPCFTKPNKNACETDCQCARCYGSGSASPMKGCVPACRQSECLGNWDPFSSPCAGSPTTSQPPAPTTTTTFVPTSQPPAPTTSTTFVTTSQPPVPTTTTTTQAAPPTSSGLYDCSPHNGNAQACMADCNCGYCPTIAGGCGCLSGDASGPDPGHGCTCGGTWQFFGPC